MQLDDYSFSIGTAAYTSLQRRSSGRWARIPLLGGGEAMQWVGTDHDTITLTGAVYPQLARYVQNLTGINPLDELVETIQQGAGDIANAAQQLNRLLNNPSLETIRETAQTISGQVGTQAIDTLRGMLHDGLPYLLQSAEGYSLGYWVILDLINLDTHYVRNIPRKQQFRLTLQYYGESAL